MADRGRGLAVGGIGAMHLAAQHSGLVEMIDKHVHVLKRHLPYHESDHVLNVAYNLLCGGTRLEHIEHRRNDEVFLDALLISLANTGEPLYRVNRSGNRPSSEGAAECFDRAIRLCRRAGFRKVRLRGDTDFSQTQSLDARDEKKVQFVFGIAAMPNLVELGGKPAEKGVFAAPAPAKVRVEDRASPAAGERQRAGRT